jgi:hypothetical protein
MSQDAKVALDVLVAAAVLRHLPGVLERAAAGPHPGLVAALGAAAPHLVLDPGEFLSRGHAARFSTAMPM